MPFHRMYLGLPTLLPTSDSKFAIYRTRKANLPPPPPTTNTTTTRLLVWHVQGRLWVAIQREIGALNSMVQQSMLDVSNHAIMRVITPI